MAHLAYCKVQDESICLDFQDPKKVHKAHASIDCQHQTTSPGTLAPSSGKGFATLRCAYVTLLTQKLEAKGVSVHYEIVALHIQNQFKTEFLT